MTTRTIDMDIAGLPQTEHEGPAFAWIDPHDIHIDPRYQRPLDAERINGWLEEGYKPELFHPLVCNRRADGLLWTYDGQHRREFAIRASVRLVPCWVHSGLTLEEESRAFRETQDRTKHVSALDKFHARVYAEHDDDAISLLSAVEATGFTIARSASASRPLNSISAVAALQTVYRLGGPMLVTAVLSVIHACWPEDDRRATQGTILQALGWIVSNHVPGDFTLDGFTERLGNQTPQMVQRRAAERAIQGRLGTIDALYRTMLDIYNGGRRKGLVAPRPLTRRGDQSDNTILTAELVRDARRRVDAGERQQDVIRDVMTRTEASYGTIKSAIRRETWRHID